MFSRERHVKIVWYVKMGFTKSKNWEKWEIPEYYRKSIDFFSSMLTCMLLRSYVLYTFLLSSNISIFIQTYLSIIKTCREFFLGNSFWKQLGKHNQISIFIIRLKDMKFIYNLKRYKKSISITFTYKYNTINQLFKTNTSLQMSHVKYSKLLISYFKLIRHYSCNI